MPFVPGHQHSAKARLFYGAVMRALHQDDGVRLRNAAEKLLDKAAAGEPWAMLMLRDTLDGKPMQQVEAKVETSAAQADPIEQVRLVQLALRQGLLRLQAAEQATDVTPVEPNAAE